MCVCGNTQSHRSVSPSGPSFEYRLPAGGCCFLCVCLSGREYILHTPDECPWRERGERERVSVSVPKSAELQAKPYPDLVLPIPACCVGVLPWILACSPPPAVNGRFSLRSLPPCGCVLCFLLRSVGSSCSGCLPSLSTGRARNLRRRNFKSRAGEGGRERGG